MVAQMDTSSLVRMIGSLLSLGILFVQHSQRGITPEQDVTDLVRRPVRFACRHPVLTVKRLF